MKAAVAVAVLCAAAWTTYARHYTNSDPIATQALVPLPRQAQIASLSKSVTAHRSSDTRLAQRTGDALLIAAVNGTITNVDIYSGEILVSF